MGDVRRILVFGVAGGALIAVLQLIEYRYLIVQHSFEIYGALVAIFFAGVGIWLGTTITRTRDVIREIEVHVEVPVPAPSHFGRDEKKRAARGITDREMEILELIAAGLSTREMAQRIPVSENTVKTHASRVFAKLGARRRTQAVQLGKEQGLIP